MELSPLSTSLGPSLGAIPAGVKSHGHVRNSSGTSTHSANLGSSTSNGGGVGGSAASRSLSMNSVSSEGSNESNLVEQEEIVALTHDVRGFKEALSKLRRIFHPEREKQEILRVAAHERLGEVLRILRAILDKYPPLQSTELLMAAGQLIQQVKGYNYENGKCNQTDFFTTIDQLALAFSSRVSEYLMGDIDTSSALHPAARIRSCENLMQTPGDADSFVSSPKEGREPETLSPEDIDVILMKIDNGVNIALYRAKVWSKYAKDIITYIDKRANIEAEYSRSLSKLAQNTRQALKDESCLPLQSIYCTALDQDVCNAHDGLAMCTALQEYKFVEPLTARRVDHERQRKQIKEMWHREFKKMQEAISNLRKAKVQYFQRNQEYEKAKEALIKIENTEGIDINKIDKKKKLEEDAAQKVLEAESNYKECVETANIRHQGLENTKADVLRQVRELVLQCDTTMKAVTVTYFQMQHTFSAPAPVKFQTLCESSRLYEPGAQYLEFVKRYSSTLNPNQSEHNPHPFSFECYLPDARTSEKERKSVDSSEMSEEGASPNRTDKKDKARPLSAKAWNPAVTAVMGSDSDSVGSSQSNKSRDTSPTASPQVAGRRILSHASSGDELDMIEIENLENGYRRPCISKAASTHALRKLKTMAKCRECDTYVYFQGVECTRCGLACHKKCLEALAIQCGHKKLPRKMTTFGVDLQTHSQESQVLVPHLVSKCVDEIDRRGCEIKGIYRVSGVKSRIEKLCQSFENGANLVDLSDVHPNVIANVLKLYLRQLPEPLLTFPHYPDFIRIAKDYQTRTGDDNEAATIQELKEVVSKLKPAYFSTLSTLINHLRRIANLSAVNNMPPSNLGIVFGPTLLRTVEGGASLASLVDTCHQAKVVELLIQHATEIFPAEPMVHRSDKGSNESGRNLVNSGQKSLGDIDAKTVISDFSQINAKSTDRTNQTGQSKRVPLHLPLQLSTCETTSTGDLLKASPCSCGDLSPSLADKGEWAGILPSDDEPFDSLPSELVHLKFVNDVPVRPSQDDKQVPLEEAVSSDAQIPLNSSRIWDLHLDSSSDKINSPQARNSGLSTLERQKLPLTSTPSVRAEKTKVQATMSDAVTQTDVSFLRNLASSPVPATRKQPLLNQPVLPAAGSTSSSSVKGASASAMDKIVIHVAGPKDVTLNAASNTSKAKTFSKETQSSDLGSDTKTANEIEDPGHATSIDSLENNTNCTTSRLKSASSQVSLIDIECPDKSLEGLPVGVERQNHVRQCESECSRADEKKLGLLNSSQNQTDQDSGFEETRSTPNNNPGRYVSPYLTDDPYKKYRIGTGSSLRLSKTTTFANYDLSHRRTPILPSNHERPSSVRQTVKGPLQSTGCNLKCACDSLGKDQDIPNKNITSNQNQGISVRDSAYGKLDGTNGKVQELSQDEEWKEREQHFV